MRWYSGLIVLIMCTLLSCAHRSGKRGPYAKNGNEVVPSSNVNHSEGKSIRLSGVDKNDSRTTLSPTQIFKKYNTAVFLVLTSDGQMTAQGSGFFIDPQGLAVSNYHVFKGTTIGAEAIKLDGSDRIYKVKDILVRDEDHDFIIFRVNCSGNNYLKIADGKPEVGDKVYAIGSPMGLENTFSSGEVSQWRSDEVMQTNVQIDHGSSGGALINEYGEVVGITSGTFAEGSQANLNYAWSIDVIKPYLEQ